MTARSLAALILFALVSTAGLAQAGDAPRRVTTTDGQVLEGVVVERGDSYLVLRLDDGTLLELLQDRISRIEVLGEPEGPGRRWDDHSRRRPLDDARERQQEGVHLDGLDDVALEARLARATGGHALSIAPMVPSMAAGIALMVSAPITAGTYFWPGQYGVGMALVGGSVVSAAGGAHLAGIAAGQTEPSERFKAGLVMAMSGATLFTVPLGLTYGVSTGFLQSTGLESTLAPFLAASGLGTLITGNIVLAVDAGQSRLAVERRLVRDDYAEAHRPIRPQFAGASFGPGLDGGFHGSVSLSF